MDDQNKNLILATGLSFLVILIWFVLFPPPEPEQTAETATTSETAQAQADGDVVLDAQDTRANDQSEITSAEAAPQKDTDIAPRVKIDTPTLEGSVWLKGGRIDELRLKKYRETLDEDSPIVTLLSPQNSSDGYYALFGWKVDELDRELRPNSDTIWTQESSGTLSPENSLVLSWDNGEGLIFKREMAVDSRSMFTITQTVENKSDTDLTARSYGIIARQGEPEDLKNFFILHEGAIRIVDGELTETDYDDIDAKGTQDDVLAEETAWSGFTDHYWMTALIPGEGNGAQVATSVVTGEIYNTEVRQPGQILAAGTSVSASIRLFAGAKEWETIRNYQNDEGVSKFLDSIDWGWFFFLTKPIFAVLHYLNAAIGNMGWAIIALTLLIKAVLLPLAYKSYVSMAKMKELQPQMEKLKEAAGDDRQKLQKSMMELYKKEKVNPASGCLPILLQIPIFFSLYKVIFVTLELRHAPWIGWIKDLSAPDPSSLYNLWGVFPWAAPEPGSILALIFIGILPLFLGLSMWLQQKLNPAPTDPTQQMIFAWMPWIFMFMLGSFASGLVVYWIANNVITFSQQYLIMRSQGYKPDVFGNIRASFKRKPKPEEK